MESHIMFIIRFVKNALKQGQPTLR